MAFFILVKGNVTEFNFNYLKDSDKQRLADTQIHGEQKVHYYEIDKLSTDIFAIELMSKKVEMLSPANKVGRARELMSELNIHHLPLQVDKRVVGVISHTDIKNVNGMDRLVDHMQRTILCVSETTPLKHIIAVFLNEHVHCLPVVDDKLLLTGIITDSDIYKWMLKNNKCVK